MQASLAYPGEEFQGKVVRIGNRVEAESRTMEVRIEADNADARLKPGMFADVEIVTTIWQDTPCSGSKALSRHDSLGGLAVADSDLCVSDSASRLDNTVARNAPRDLTA